MSTKIMAPRGGLEPPTNGLTVSLWQFYGDARLHTNMYLLARINDLGLI